MKEVLRFKLALFFLKIHKALLFLFGVLIFARLLASIGYFVLGTKDFNLFCSMEINTLLPIFSIIFLLLARAFDKDLVDIADY